MWGLQVRNEHSEPGATPALPCIHIHLFLLPFPDYTSSVALRMLRLLQGSVTTAIWGWNVNTVTFSILISFLASLAEMPSASASDQPMVRCSHENPCHGCHQVLQVQILLLLVRLLSGSLRYGRWNLKRSEN
jgi:hypothetical protein